jgi:hypothetical protein
MHRQEGAGEYLCCRRLQEAVGGSERYILSFGCGVNTAALMVRLVERHLPFDEAVFADTGAELPETYSYLNIARNYLGDHGIPLVIVKSRVGTLYDTCKRRKVIPSGIWRWSTRDYKVTPIHRYYRSLDAQIFEYLGIAYDEVSRMKRSREPYITSLFPLVDERLGRADCVRIIERAGLPVPVKSGCYFCPFNSLDRWAELYRAHPELYQRAVALEEGSKHFPRQTLTPATLRVLRKEIRTGKVSPTDGQTDSPCGAYCMT